MLKLWSAPAHLMGGFMVTESNHVLTTALPYFTQNLFSLIISLILSSIKSSVWMVHWSVASVFFESYSYWFSAMEHAQWSILRIFKIALHASPSLEDQKWGNVFLSNNYCCFKEKNRNIPGLGSSCFIFFCEVFFVLSSVRRHQRQMCLISSPDDKHCWLHTELPFLGRLRVHTTHGITHK